MKDKKSARHKSTAKTSFRKSGFHVLQRDEPYYLYGLHVLEAALKNPKRDIKKILLTKNAQQRLPSDLLNHRVTELTTPKHLTQLLGKDAVHQGAAALVSPLVPLETEDLADAKLIIVLDQVTDPHNVGAILRSACAFNADALLTTTRHSAHETGVLAKSASGALDYLSLVEVTNLAKGIEWLIAAGFQVIGLDSEANASFSDIAISDKVALVLGAEGKGLRQKTQSLCTNLVRLEMPGAIRSLNVSNAAAISLFAITADKS